MYKGIGLKTTSVEFLYCVNLQLSKRKTLFFDKSVNLSPQSTAWGSAGMEKGDRCQSYFSSLAEFVSSMHVFSLYRQRTGNSKLLKMELEESLLAIDK